MGQGGKPLGPTPVGTLGPTPSGVGTLAGALLTLSVPAAFLLLFFYYPLGSVLWGAVRGAQGGVGADRLAALLSDPYILRIIGFTVLQALLSTLLSLLLGLPGAYLLARYDFPGKGLVRALTTVPFVLPSIIVVLGFVRFFGNNGVLNRALMGLLHLEEPPLRLLYSLKAILLAHAFYNFPICVRLISTVWARLKPSTEEAGRSLGAHGLRLFWRVSLPQLLPAMLSAAALVFLFCFLSFAVVLVLGGGPRYTTLEVEVYRLAKVSLDLDRASALALVGALLSLAFLYAYIRLQRRSGFTEELACGFEQRRLSELLRRPAGIFFIVYLLFMGLVILAPMATVIAYSVQERASWSRQVVGLGWYRRILSARDVYLPSVLNSLFFGLTTVALAVPIGTVLAYVSSRTRLARPALLEALLMLPIGVSSIVLGLGYLKAYQQWPWRHLPWRLTGTRYAIVFAHAVIAYPFVIRVTSAMFRKIRPSLAEAARSLGAGPWRLFWRLELPLVRGALITGAAFAFGVSVGEINATLMLYNPRAVTMPVMIYRLISSYNFVGAAALGTVLMLFCFLAFLVIDRSGGEV